MQQGGGGGSSVITGEQPLPTTDATGRPLASENYSIWNQFNIPNDLLLSGRPAHFRNANEQLYNMLELNPEMKDMIPKKVVEHVQPGTRGGFKSTSPPEHSWHHNAQNPVKIELVPRAQHKAPGDVQKSLHPNQQGGFKKLQTGIE
nr:HNH endonuclease [Serratia fonticola]